MPLIEFRVLGPIAVSRNGEPVHVPAGSQQVVLATLLLRANQVVPVSELVEWLWEDEPPSDAWESAKAYVRRLRRTLEAPDLIEAMPDGFRLTVSESAVDMLRFRRLLREAESLSGVEQLDRLDQALALWGDEPLAGLVSSTAKSRAVHSLVEEYGQAVEKRADGYLRLGRHAELVTTLRAMTARYPDRERVWSQLMVALYRSGKRVEALAAYRRARAYLADEFGITPGAELERTHHGVLTDTLDDAAGDTHHPNTATPTLVRLIPAQLPATIGDFVGRTSELATARAALTSVSGESAPVLVISGMPGVGKSAFAVKLAHEVRTRFPDGQLFIDLHGYSEHTPLSPARVLSRILPALGLPSTQVPTDLDDLTNTYRSLVADRRILLVLDNAANAQQVHDLIPAAPESAVLITSRSQMPSLAALTGARLLQLGPLKPQEAGQLIHAILATAPVPADTDIEQIVELCGYLPLAMRVAATAYLHSARPLTDFLTELKQRDRLSALTIADDPRATVRAVFDLSYRTLTADAARLFRLLSLVPGPDLCRNCAYHVADLSPGRTEQLLGELTAASLIHPARPRHYRFHDLVRLYAHDRCVTEDDPDVLHTALARLYGYYVTTADKAADVLYPTWARLPRTHATIVASDHAVAPNAAEWMSDEAPNLIATIRYTAQHGPAEIAWYLSESLRAYVVTHGEYRIEALGAFEIALAAAEAAENRRATAAMHSAFSSVYLRIRDIQRALPHIRAELDHYVDMGFPEGEVRARIALAEALATQGYLRDAADQLDEALRTTERHDLTKLQLLVLLNFSFLEERRDQLDVAKKYALSALDLVDSTSSGSVVGSIHAALGIIMTRRGEFDAAIEQHLMALECYRPGADQHYESEALRELAHAYSKTGNTDESIAHATKALAVAEELGDEYDIADSLVAIAGIYHELDLTDQARTHAQSALKMSNELDYIKARVEATLQLASIDKSEGRLDQAQEHATRAADLAQQGELRRLRGDAEILLAWITHEKGNHAHALQHATNAFTIHQEVNSPYGQTRALHVKGLALLAQGEGEQARQELSMSLEIFQGPPTPEIDEIRQAVSGIF